MSSNTESEVKAPSSTSKAKGRRGRSRKRKSAESQDLNQLIEEAEKTDVTPRKSKRTSRGTRASKRGTRLHLSGNDDNLVPIEVSQCLLNVALEKLIFFCLLGCEIP